jgi:sugar-phosphatase
MPNLTCSAILFDLDGVLIDSSACIEHHWRQWAELHNLDLAAIMQVAHGRRTIETMQAVAPYLDLVAEAQRFEAAEVLDTDGIVASAGALDLLNSLPPGSWTIVTSGSRALATARLRSRGLPVPPLMVTADDVVNGKPHPEPYLTAAARLGLTPDECVVVEDAPAGLAAAHAAGMRTIAVASTHAVEELGAATVVAQSLAAIKVSLGAARELVVIVAGSA